MLNKKSLIKRQIALLLLGSLVIFIIIASAAKIAVHNLEQNAQRLEELVTQTNAKYEQITIMSDSIRERLIIFYRIIHSDDIFEIDQLILDSSEKAAAFIKARESLLGLSLTPSQRGQVEAQKKLLSESQQFFDNVIDKILSDDTNIASVAIANVHKANNAVLSSLEHMRKQQSELAQFELSAARLSKKETEQKIRMLGVLALILSALVIVFIIRQLHQQAKALSAAMEQLQEYNTTLEHRVETRTQELMETREENIRIHAELDITHQIQHIILPTKDELKQIECLDVAIFMQAAEKIGGDYIDVLKHQDGLLIGVGDVTGHGLESGIIMLMAQSMIRSQFYSYDKDLKTPIKAINGALYENISRMQNDKHLSLLLANYLPQTDQLAIDGEQENGRLYVTGQHENIIIVRNNGQLELIDTDDLGFPIGLVDDVASFFNEIQIKLHSGDVVIFYTDGITEAANSQETLFGLDMLCQICQQSHHMSSEDIIKSIVHAVQEFIGEKEIYDDLSLVVLKQP